MMQDIIITEHEICVSMKKLKENKANGADNIHPRVLNRFSITLCIPLLMIYTQSLLEGQLPQEWKGAVDKDNPVDMIYFEFSKAFIKYRKGPEDDKWKLIKPQTSKGLRCRSNFFRMEQSSFC